MIVLVVSMMIAASAFAAHAKYINDREREAAGITRDEWD